MRRIFDAVLRLDKDGSTFVSFADVDKFTSVCEAVGIVACGGAFATDMSGQYFYKSWRAAV